MAEQPTLMERLESHVHRLLKEIELFETFQAVVDRAATHGSIPEEVSDASDHLDSERATLSKE